MKIGEFAKKFNLNISTVRYYINTGLLVPEKSGEQYYFNEKCADVMNEILRYKSYHFTLEEIRLLFFLENASNFKDDTVLKLYREILTSKQKELVQEKEELRQLIAALGNEIQDLPKNISKENIKSGVPFSFIPYLYCPKCQTPLKLDSASMANNFLHHGHLSCDCGYMASIQNGMVVCQKHYKESPLKAFENIDSVMGMTEEYGPGYRSLINKTYIYMYNNLPDNSNKQLFIMAGPLTFNFLLSYIEELGENNMYIITDPSIKRIEKMKQYLEGRSNNIIFFVGATEDIPLKENCLDIYIDDYSTTNCMFTNNSFDTDKIAPFIKKSGRIVGIFGDYKQAPLSLSNFKNDHKNFDPKKMTFSRLKYSWEQNHIKTISEKSMGNTVKNISEYAQDVPGETLNVIGYVAKKQ